MVVSGLPVITLLLTLPVLYFRLISKFVISSFSSFHSDITSKRSVIIYSKVLSFGYHGVSVTAEAGKRSYKIAEVDKRISLIVEIWLVRAWV